MSRVVPRQVILGCDPEIFVVQGATVLPAYKYLPGKHHALEEGEHVMDTYANNHTAHAKVFWDGVQAEFSMRPETCLSWLGDNVQLGLSMILKEARKVAPDARLTLTNVLTYPEGERLKAKREHVELGCSPSMNAYGMGGERPGDGRKLPVRFAGGHKHITSARMMKEPEAGVKFLDATLGIWSVGAAQGIDNPIRRRFYGLAGEFRPTKYGLEYRVLSNFWLAHPAVFHLSFELTRLFTNVFDSSVEGEWISDEMEVVNAINRCDVLAARRILERNAATLTRWLSETSGFDSEPILEVAKRGVLNTIPNARDVESNWRLGWDWEKHCNNDESTWGMWHEHLLPEAASAAVA